MHGLNCQKKRQLKWSAVLNAQNLNTQTLAAASPIDRLNGRIKARGYARPNQQIINLSGVDLTGRLAAQNETVHLTGNSNIALLFHDEKQVADSKVMRSIMMVH